MAKIFTNYLQEKSLKWKLNDQSRFLVFLTPTSLVWMSLLTKLPRGYVSVILYPKCKLMYQPIRMVILTFPWLYSIALSMIKSSESPKASLPLVSVFRGSMRQVVNSSTEFANFFSSSTSGLSWRAWYLRYPLTLIHMIRGGKNYAKSIGQCNAV